MALKCCTLILPLLLTIASLEGCTYTAAVSQTNIPAQRGKEVTANVHKFIFLGFNFTNDEVLRLTGELRDKCPGGDVRGILTKDVRTMYFLFFFWARETSASGFCLPHKHLALEGQPGPDDAKPRGAPGTDMEMEFGAL